MINPLSSASGMNRAGAMMPRVGCAHRTSASTPPLGHFGSHGLVEHGDGVAPGVLGLVHGSVGVANQDLGTGVGIVTRGERQTDAGGHVELVLVDDERSP